MIYAEVVNKQHFITDLTNVQWKLIKTMLPYEPYGRPCQISKRRILNALCYIVVTGVQWRLLPLSLPKWQIVYYHFRRWQKQGYWSRICHMLRTLCRQWEGRHKHPTAACLDSQSFAGSCVIGERGYDAAKRIKGRKRHLLVDTQGLPLGVVVTGANVSDSAGAKQVLKRLGRKRGITKKLRLIWVDAGYKRGIIEWCDKWHSITMQVVTAKPNQKGFAVQPRRWVVERSFSWLNGHRRLARNYETLTQCSEAMIWLAFMQIMIKRLT